MTIWEQARGIENIRALSNTLYRVVETQEQQVTSSLVDSLEKAQVLDELLDNSKPTPPQDTDGLHHLLKTPFRYPPLRHGSRFGGKHERGMLYGSLSAETCLWELGFYRLYFANGPKEPGPNPIRVPHSLLTADYQTEHGVQLQKPPFTEFTAILRHPVNYQATQALGNDMRKSGVNAVEFHSARDPSAGINVALFSPRALSSPAPTSQEPVICDIFPERVEFMRSDCRSPLIKVPRDALLVDGIFPDPAARGS